MGVVPSSGKGQRGVSKQASEGGASAADSTHAKVRVRGKGPRGPAKVSSSASFGTATSGRVRGGGERKDDERAASASPSRSRIRHFESGQEGATFDVDFYLHNDKEELDALLNEADRPDLDELLESARVAYQRYTNFSKKARKFPHPDRYTYDHV